MQRAGRSYPCVIWISAECVLKMKTKNTSWQLHLLYSTLYLHKRNVFQRYHEVNKWDDTALREYAGYRSSSFKKADGGYPFPFKSPDGGYTHFVHTRGSDNNCDSPLIFDISHMNLYAILSEIQLFKVRMRFEIGENPSKIGLFSNLINSSCQFETKILSTF